MEYNKTCKNLELSNEKDIELYSVAPGTCLGFICEDVNKNGCLRDGYCQECSKGFNCDCCKNYS